jgi:ubiquinone/menaquinone biosynthesis C-methylase UbiE
VKRWKKFLIAAATIAALAGAAVWLYDRRSRGAERERVVAMVGRPGATVAEIGAGDGWLSLEVARRVGPGGRVLATEIEADKRDAIRRAAVRAGLNNVTVVEAQLKETGLPDACCDAVFLRNVYHHLSDPAAIDLSILRALKPGGLLLVMDFEPAWWLGPWKTSAPANRGGHGMPRPLLVEELTQAGFEQVREAPDWPGIGYAVVARKKAG